MCVALVGCRLANDASTAGDVVDALEGSHDAIVEVGSHLDLHGRPLVAVRLAENANGRVAMEIWCDVIKPQRLDARVDINVYRVRDGVASYWPRLTNCADRDVVPTPYR